MELPTGSAEISQLRVRRRAAFAVSKMIFFPLGKSSYTGLESIVGRSVNREMHFCGTPKHFHTLKRFVQNYLLFLICAQ